MLLMLVDSTQVLVVETDYTRAQRLEPQCHSRKFLICGARIQKIRDILPSDLTQKPVKQGASTNKEFVETCK